jgi:soluble lytic murein transglycosylase-like protein
MAGKPIHPAVKLDVDAMYDYEEYDDYEAYDDYDDESVESGAAQRWAAPNISLGNIGLPSVYALPPLAAVGLSVILILTMIGFFARQFQIPEAQGSAGPAFRASTALAPLFSPSVQHWDHKIIEWAEKWDMDPNLLATVMQIESCGDPQAVSSAGAIGLFQVMPFHFTNSEDPYKPTTNARASVTYLKQALQSFDQDVYFALAGYNAGIAGAGRGEANWPDETVRYTHWAVGIFEDAQAGKKNSDRLDEWLAAGGKSLCNQASQRLGLSN